MAKKQKNSMHEGQNKIARFMRLDQLLRSPQGVTLKEIMKDGQMDEIGERTLRANLSELEEKYGAEYELNMNRGRERLWRYKDTDFSIMKQTSADVEVIRKAIENLNIFRGDPRYDILRYYLIGLEHGVSDSNVTFMSFDINNDTVGLEHIESLLNAITNRYPLKMIYKPFGKPEIEVNIHPYHLRQYNRRWFIFGLVEDRDEVQNYALDRIVKLEHLSKTFIESDIDFEEYFDDIVGVSNYKKRSVEEILLRIDKKSIDYIRTKPIHWTQTELKSKNNNTDEYSYIQLKVKVNTELMMHLFSYSDSIEVLEPAWLRNTFAKRIKKMSEMYKV